MIRNRYQQAPLALALSSVLLFPATGLTQSIQPDEVKTLDSVQVVGRQDSGVYYAYAAEGSKSNLTLRELPQSVRIMSRQAIDDLGATRLDETLDYVGGISRQNNFGGLWDNFAVRGLPGNENTGSAMLLNGFAGNRGFNAPRDTAGIERIEFLKGPAAALYGSSEPGGTINVVSKRPLWRPGHALETYASGYGSWRVAADSTGPIGETLAYRLNVASEHRGTMRDHVESDRIVVAPALDLKLSDALDVRYTGEWIRHRAPLDRGIVAIDGELGVVPRERFLGEPDDGDVEVDNRTHQLLGQYAAGTDWTLRLGVSRRDGTLRGFSTEPHALQPDGRTLRRQRRYRDYASEDVSMQAEAQGTVRTGSVEHDLLFGTEAYRFELDQRMLRINPTAANPYAIDLFAPVYGQTRPTPLPNTDTSELQRNRAVYLQDSVRLSDRWRVLAGMRMDRYDQTLDNLRTGARTRQRPQETSPRLGLSYLPNAQWTFYGNIARSFRPNVGVDAGGTAFVPERGRAMEAGVKWERPDGRIGATLALFDIRKQNVLTADPVEPGFSTATGEVRSRGVEFDLAGQVTERWRVNTSFVYDEVEILRDNAFVVGSSLINVPKVNGSLLAVREGTLTGGSLYGFGGGVTHTGERLGEGRTRAAALAGRPAFMLPAYTTAKFVAYWRPNANLRITLDIDNLFDKTYYISSVSPLWVTPGAGRSIVLGVQTHF